MTKHIARYVPPLRLHIAEALHVRLPQEFQPELKKSLLSARAGVRGERSIEYYLEDYTVNEHIYLRDVRLPYGTHHFQLDGLILTTNFILVTEVKQYAGTVTYDPDLQQITRLYDNELATYEDPLQQVKRAVRKLTTWLNLHGFPPIHIEPCVIFSNNSTPIELANSRASTLPYICRPGGLHDRLHDLFAQHRNPWGTMADVRALYEHLVQHHVYELPSYSDNTAYAPYIKSGVRCPACKKLMSYSRPHWVCRCGRRDRSAYRQALYDYALLKQSTISTREFLEFAHLSSRYLSQLMLNEVNLPHLGDRYHRRYDLSPFFRGEIIP
ncbi:NERD domain-containing protein [Paenalkalicoccus suaedae]|uniref:NERD domain-containing protein n=1 Tax=Paenalkalicoccus suaedae TaxID=2592382 RepID=A0A859FB14_9BACI|nr:nuclease-related domain-containing protein [Paenalkalicoccus suaedae]QKS69988.1 NERD domain-containing protein [Paenalkalicoccus suaedae]